MKWIEMKKEFFRREWFAGTFLLTFLSFVNLLDSSAQSGKQVYANYCGGCHGAELQGSRASAFIKKTWKYGGDRNSILNNIRHGIPGTEMAKWEGTLSAKEIGQ